MWDHDHSGGIDDFGTIDDFDFHTRNFGKSWSYGGVGFCRECVSSGKIVLSGTSVES